jgi:hypothetical protein
MPVLIYALLMGATTLGLSVVVLLLSRSVWAAVKGLLCVWLGMGLLHALIVLGVLLLVTRKVEPTPRASDAELLAYCKAHPEVKECQWCAVHPRECYHGSAAQADRRGAIDIEAPAQHVRAHSRDRDSHGEACRSAMQEAALGCDSRGR